MKLTTKTMPNFFINFLGIYCAINIASTGIVAKSTFEGTFKPTHC